MRAYLLGLIRRHWHLTMQLVRYGIVGVITTAADFGVYTALTRLSDYWRERRLAAVALAFVLAVLTSFVLNTFWTFHSDFHKWHHKIAKFSLVACGGFCLNFGVFFLLNHLAIHDLVAKIGAEVVVITWNFTLQKFWTYRA